MVAIPLRDVRRDLALCDLRRKFTDRALVVGELELRYAGTASAVTLRPPS
jgi:hypothetical protein